MKTLKDAGGMSKDPMDLSIVKACWTEKLLICAYTVQNMIVVAQIGSNPVNILTSSTLVTEQRLHGFGVGDSLVPVSLLVMTAALSKHLPYKFCMSIFLQFSWSPVTLGETQYPSKLSLTRPGCRLKTFELHESKIYFYGLDTT